MPNVADRTDACATDVRGCAAPHSRPRRGASDRRAGCARYPCRVLHRGDQCRPGRRHARPSRRRCGHLLRAVGVSSLPSVRARSGHRGRSAVGRRIPVAPRGPDPARVLAHGRRHPAPAPVVGRNGRGYRRRVGPLPDVDPDLPPRLEPVRSLADVVTGHRGGLLPVAAVDRGRVAGPAVAAQAHSALDRRFRPARQCFLGVRTAPGVARPVPAHHLVPAVQPLVRGRDGAGDDPRRAGHRDGAPAVALAGSRGRVSRGLSAGRDRPVGHRGHAVDRSP